MFDKLISFLNTLTPNIDNTSGGDDVDVDVGDIDGDVEVNVYTGEETDEKAVVGRSEVTLYPETFTPEEWQEYRRLVEAVKRDNGRIARADAEQSRSEIESVPSDEVGEVADFFDGLVSNRHLRIIRSSQYTRKITDQPSSSVDVYRAKGDLADKFGYDAYYIANLVSSGYFDRNRCLREMYREIESEDSETAAQFRQEFETLIREELIATFVNTDDSPHEVKTDIKSGIFGHLRYEPRTNFFDVCGLGASCGQSIDEAVSNLGENYPALETEGRDRGEERVERLDPDTIQNFGIA